MAKTCEEEEEEEETGGTCGERRLSARVGRSEIIVCVSMC